MEIPVRNWRVTRGIPSGAHVWFDPEREAIRLYSTSVSEPETSLSALGVDMGAIRRYLDRVVSVSGLESEARVASDDLIESTELEELSTMELPF